MSFSNSDDKHALGLDPGTGGYLGLNTQAQYGHQPYYTGMPSRPRLAGDTSASAYQNDQMPQLGSSQSSAPGSSTLLDTASYDTASYDGERVITPGMQFDYQNYNTGFTYSLDNHLGTPDVPQWPNQYQPQYYADLTPQPSTNNYTFNPVQSQGTISPSQLGHAELNYDNLKNRSFSDLMQSRGSSSSASSTDDGRADVNALEEWQKLHRVLPMTNDHLRAPSNPQASVPEPAKRNELLWSAHQKPSKPSFHIAGSPLSAPSGDALDSALRSYISSPNRLAFGERKVVVMSPKVGQKSYGTEKRFLCPHPQAILLGSSWWHRPQDGCPAQTRLPPRVNISLEGENPVKDALCSWTTTDGHNLDEKINTQTLKAEEIPFIGNVAGKNLHISDSDSKRREARALVTVKAPFNHHAGTHGWGPAKGSMSDISNDEVVGIFPSKEIKIISKPSKKKANAKSSERESFICHDRY